MGHVRHAFTLAFYCLLKAATMEEDEAYNHAMEQTAMLAGDTDTNCAIVGGLVGAYVGVSKIPKEKLKKVLECNLEEGNQCIRPDFC